MENLINLKKTDEFIDVELVGYGHDYSSTDADYCECNTGAWACSAPGVC